MFLLKTDDDSFNVLQHFVEYLYSFADADVDSLVFVGGLCSSGEMPNNNHRHKYFIPKSSYPGKIFPYHCKVCKVQYIVDVIVITVNYCKMLFTGTLTRPVAPRPRLISRDYKETVTSHKCIMCAMIAYVIHL